MPLRELSTMFLCRGLFGPTVVPFFPCNKGFIYLLHFHVSVYPCPLPLLLFVCLCFSYWFFLVLLAYFFFCFFFFHFPDIFQPGFWDFDQDALADGFIQGLAERLNTTILSSKATSTSLLYHRAFRKRKEFAISTFDPNVFPATHFHVALYLQRLIEKSYAPCVIDSALYGIKWAHSMAGIPSSTDNPIVEAVRAASKRILGTGIVNRKEPISSSVINDIIIRSNLSLVQKAKSRFDIFTRNAFKQGA